MKIWRYALLILIVFTSVSCSANTPSPSNNQEANVNHANSNQNRPMETEKYTVEKIEFSITDFRPLFVKLLDDQNMAVILNNKFPGKPHSELIDRVYIYNLETKNKSLVFEGKFLGNNWIANFKQTNLGNFLIEGSISALEIEKDTFKLKGLIPFPQGTYEEDSSHDQSQVLYNNEGGLYLHTLNSPSSQDTLIYKRDTRENQPVPTKPLWSFDDKKISYFLYNHANQALNQVLILDPISGKQKSFTVSNLESGWWFDDSKRFVTFSTGAVIGLIPKITVIDTGNDEVHEYQTTGDVEMDSSPFGDQVLYLHKDQGELEKGKYPPERLVVLNVATNTSEIVTPDFLNIRSYAFSPSGNEIMFIGNLTPGEDQSIYMARKKKS
ncbi:hypothetical protein [Paradesulfitobacterium ferrireducens]|uniref:hypothetical protein n=1 Tax=Paradesulfitobacterium ferrireducens TaxID=2816476 RepID=UPI001A8CA6E0|nr:hypothetical protein [Paradesulfitobacterium ferrireducens]